jgi:MarR family transcriptional regulator, organic hydroperoxide resistance regulator
VSRRIASASPSDVLAAERDIRAALGAQPFDFAAMSAIANIYRCGTTVRKHMERTVLAEYDLSWAAFTVLWVLWIWGPAESAALAGEAGISKGTLTGVIRTLTSRGLVRRLPHRTDLRRVTLKLSRAGERTIHELFPVFNSHETLAIRALSAAEQRELARLLRVVIAHVSSVDRNDAETDSALA